MGAIEEVQGRDTLVSLFLLHFHLHQCLPLVEPSWKPAVMGAWETQPAGVSPPIPGPNGDAVRNYPKAGASLGGEERAEMRPVTSAEQVPQSDRGL